MEIMYPSVPNPPIDNVKNRLPNSGCSCSGNCGMHYPAAFKHGFLFDDEFTSASGGYHTGVQKGTCATCSSTCDDISATEAVEAWAALIESPSDQYGNFGTDVICKSFKSNGNGFRCLDKLKPPATKELAIERYASEYPLATICAPLKQNNPFQCTPIDNPPTTKVAIERYTSAYTPETICAPLKQNGPFQCTRNVEVPTATILSLSVATAQAVFAVGGLVFVSLLRKLEKLGKDTSTLVDDDLRILVRKVRVGQDELRREFRNCQEELRGDQSQHEELIQNHEELIQNLLQKGGDHQA